MGLFWFQWAIIAWWSVGICGYNVQRLEDDRNQPLNLEIDFFSSAETNKFFDDLEKSTSEDSFSNNIRNVGTTHSPAGNDSTPLDSWSVVWYIASFGGLIVFFLIVSCSEWCCRRAIRNSQRNCSGNAPAPATPTVPDTPPPSYDHFAPPSYESICLGRNRSGEKSEYDIYVVPVHTLGTLVESRREDAPPSYLSASGGALARSENSRVTGMT